MNPALRIEKQVILSLRNSNWNFKRVLRLNKKYFYQRLSLKAFLVFLLFPSAVFCQEQRLVMAVPGEPKTFNAVIAQESSSLLILDFLFDGLIRLNPFTGEAESSLAERWESSVDGLSWTLYLRKDVKWFDGVLFTSKDVVFTFNELIYNPNVPASSRDVFLVNGKKIEVTAIDDFTVQFKLPSPFAPFLNSLAQSIFPQHILREKVKSGTFASVWGIEEKPESIIGTGPFRLQSYSMGEKIVLERNPYYWGKDDKGNQLPYLDKIIFLIVSNPEVRLLKFMQGETDLYSLDARDYPLLFEEQEKRSFQLLKLGMAAGNMFIAFNFNNSNSIKKKWFLNPRIRKALSHAIDKQSMVEIVHHNLGGEECSSLSPSIPVFYNAHVSCDEYDPEKAKRLLAHAGFEDRNRDGWLEDEEGNKFEFRLMTNAEDPERSQMAAMIREDLAKIGVRVYVAGLEFNSLVAKLLTTQDWDGVVMGFTGSLSDPHFAANVWLSNGRLHFWNKGEGRVVTNAETQIDALFSQAAGEINTRKRKDIYDKWQQVVSEDSTLVYLALPEVVVAVRDKIKNLKPSALSGIFHHPETIRVDAK